MYDQPAKILDTRKSDADELKNMRRKIEAEKMADDQRLEELERQEIEKIKAEMKAKKLEEEKQKLMDSYRNSEKMSPYQKQLEKKLEGHGISPLSIKDNAFNMSF